MTGPRIVGGEARGKTSLAPAPDKGWRLLGTLGVVFAVVAAADLALAWYPAAFGNPEWEFGTVTSVMGGLPLVAMGLALWFGAAVARGKRGSLRLVSVVLLLLSLVLLAALALYLRRVPGALAGVTDPVIRSGLREAIAKTVLQGLLFPAAFVWMGIKGWRHAALE